MAAANTYATGPLSTQLLETIDLWSRSQSLIVVAAAEFADSDEWALAGSPTAAHWLAAVADIETATARAWVRAVRFAHFPSFGCAETSTPAVIRDLALQGPGPHTHHDSRQRNRTIRHRVGNGR